MLIVMVGCASAEDTCFAHHVVKLRDSTGAVYMKYLRDTTQQETKDAKTAKDGYRIVRGLRRQLFGDQ